MVAGSLHRVVVGYALHMGVGSDAVKMAAQKLHRAAVGFVRHMGVGSD